jgi:hypothetical protein
MAKDCAQDKPISDLIYSPEPMRAPNDVITQAINENRIPEYMLYAFACIFVITGVVLIGWSIHVRGTVTGVAGVALSGLSWPAYNATKDLRAVNVMLRMLEVPLSMAQTSEEAAKMLTETFAQLFRHEIAKRAGK